jgi:hypothetical protein
MAKKAVSKIRWLKRIVGVVGILLTTVGWAISNADRIEVVKSVLAPKYDVAM